jgi:hypothetical protein
MIDLSDQHAKGIKFQDFSQKESANILLTRGYPVMKGGEGGFSMERNLSSKRKRL